MVRGPEILRTFLTLEKAERLLLRRGPAPASLFYSESRVAVTTGKLPSCAPQRRGEPRLYTSGLQERPIRSSRLRENSPGHLILGGAALQRCDNWPIFNGGFSRRGKAAVQGLVFPQPARRMEAARRTGESLPELAEGAPLPTPATRAQAVLRLRRRSRKPSIRR